MDKAAIISQLQKEVLNIQGFKPYYAKNDLLLLGPIGDCFPNKQFPIGQTHEFIISDQEDRAATLGFINAISSSLLGKEKIGVWISNTATVYPPGLINYGVSPNQVLFVHTRNEKETLWVMEEALRCEGLAVVASEVNSLDFTASRRLQLAVEKSHVTGFIIRSAKYVSTSASASRWRIQSLPSNDSSIKMPGIHFPKWNIELLKVRNGKTGSWEVTWKHLQLEFELKSAKAISLFERERKIV